MLRADAQFYRTGTGTTGTGTGTGAASFKQVLLQFSDFVGKYLLAPAVGWHLGPPALARFLPGRRPTLKHADRRLLASGR